MKKIALVNQRYGEAVNGGSEYYTRLLAQKLTQYYDVEVLTTKAASYDTWVNYYPADVEMCNGVRVRRFKVNRKRNFFLQRVCGKCITALKLNTKLINKLWVIFQGPYTPDLIHYLKKNADQYDLIIFVTYLYYTTVYGLPAVKEKAIFIPTAHDEFCIYFNAYQKLFHLPKAIIYLTEEERDYVHKQFHNESIKSIVAGAGIDIPPQIDAAGFLNKYDIQKDFLLYVGRIDKNKGCCEMFDYFRNYKETHPDLTLVLIGQSFMEIPKEEGIRYLGYLSEDDKFAAIKSCLALWLPSKFESLSLSVLEAMAMGRPVIVNGQCEVLKGHCVKSGGGIYYTKYDEFLSGMERISGNEYDRLGKNALMYIEKHYTWASILNRVTQLFNQILEEETEKRGEIQQ